jgi:predicted transcriptional regulator of viral defense system
MALFRIFQLSSLPILFTKQEANQPAEKFCLSKKQCEHFLERLVAKGFLERLKCGAYRFVGGQRDRIKESNPQRDSSDK